MRARCYTLEDAHTVVLQPEGKSSLLRVHLAPTTDAHTLRAILRASPQKPVDVECTVGSWDHRTGTFSSVQIDANDTWRK